MNEQQIRTKISDYKEQLRDVENLASSLKSQIEIERSNLPPNADLLKKKYRQAETEFQKIQVKIKRKKSEARDLKDRINKLKEDFELKPEEDKLDSWNKILPEIEKYGEGIQNAEAAIGALEKQKFSAEMAIESALIKLEAYKEDMHKKPIEEDFRMKSVLQERRRIEKYIQKKELQLESMVH
jgi:DNA repair ATPase RecN